jgi:hypothetical protein
MNKYLQQVMAEDNQNGYLYYHAPRYDKALSLLCKYHKSGVRTLDIGRSPFTKIAQMTIEENVDTLGFEVDGKTETGYNYQYDLNKSQHPSGYRHDLPVYDIIVFSEVIEHLFTSPALVLNFLRTILSNTGVIILQTPNAAVLHKRMQFLFGSNPFSLISENNLNPSHFREYTMKELVSYCRHSGFQIIEKNYENYFDYRYTNHANGKFSFKKAFWVVNTFYRFMPNSMKPGLCLVIRKE